MSTLAVDGCSSVRSSSWKAADDPRENVLGTPIIDERTSPSGSSSPGNSMLSEDVSLGHSTMMTTLLVMYINILLSNRCIYSFMPNMYHISSDILFSFLLCSAPTVHPPKKGAKIHVKTKKNELIEIVRSVPRSVSRAFIPSEQHVTLQQMC